MRIVFLGTAELACPSLEALVHAGQHEVALVVTQPDRPKGRQLELAPPPVKVTATKLGLAIAQPEQIRASDALAQLQAVQPDLIVVVAYGQFLPASLLELPARGCINLHTSLLPRWRGAAPIQYAIWQGDRQTGVSTMYLNEAMDAGDIILQQPEPIAPDDTSGTLHDRLAQLGAPLLVETVNQIAAGTAPRRLQDPAGVTFARKIAKEQGRIDWTRPAAEIECMTRAFDPWPSAYVEVGGEILKIWRVAVVPDAAGAPGELMSGDVVAAGQGGVRLLEVQPAGKKRMAWDAYQRGHGVPVGTKL